MSFKPVIFLAFANDKVDNAQYLRNLSLEQRGIRTALSEAVSKGLCEVIERSSSTISDIIDVFQDPIYGPRISIFHYGGHADGFSLLLESEDGSKALTHKEGLVPFFARQENLKLIFLNGCSSEGQATDLLKSGIPAVIGTTASINDEIATSLATRFYSSLGDGSSIDKAWADATDEVKIKNGTGNTRALYWPGKQEVNDRFPWVIQFKPGAEIIKEWNLPDISGNPLYGLPAIPQSYNLPESPFLYLNRYERKHAEVFFGRSYYVRSLFSSVADSQGPPIILLCGQSGTGKSSLLEAGLQPRLESRYEIIYLRRNGAIGLSATLFNALIEKCGFKPDVSVMTETKSFSELDNLKQFVANLSDSIKSELQPIIEKLSSSSKNNAPVTTVQDQKPSSLHAAWHLVEQKLGKPLLVILDQLEEAYTRPNTSLGNEMNQLFLHLKAVFGNPASLPKGKILLSYRKEYQPEIEEYCKKYELSRSKVFIEHISKNDIVELFQEFMSSPRLMSRYHLTVENGLPELIADDLAADKEAPVAPVLQILLTKMWKKAVDLHPEAPVFTHELYHELKEQGLAMDEFLQNQLLAIKKKLPEAHDLGFVLDMLAFHCTANNTSAARTEKELSDHYPFNINAAKKVLAACKDYFLITDLGGNEHSSMLAHDTLAKSVVKAQQRSTQPIQQGKRILSSRIEAIKAGSEFATMDSWELKLIEKIQTYLPAFDEGEKKLFESSRKEIDKQERQRRRIVNSRRIIIALSILSGIVAWYLYAQSKKHEKASFVSLMTVSSGMNIEKDPTMAITQALSGLEKDSNSLELKKMLLRAYYYSEENKLAWYKTIYQSNNQFIDLIFNLESNLMVPFFESDSLVIINSEGKINGHILTSKDGYDETYKNIFKKVVWTKDGQHLVATGRDNCLYFYNNEGKMLKKICSDLFYFSDLDYLSYNTFMNRIVSLIQLDNESWLYFFNVHGEIMDSLKLSEGDYDVGEPKFSGDGKCLFVGLSDDSIFKMNLIKIDTNPIKFMKATINYSKGDHFRFSESGNLVAVYSSIGEGRGAKETYVIRNINDFSLKKIAYRYDHPLNQVENYLFHPSDSLYVVRSSNKVFVDYVNLKKEGEIVHKKKINTLHFSPLNNYILTGGEDNVGKVSTLDCTLYFELRGHINSVTGLHLDFHQQNAFTSSKDGTLRKWDLLDFNYNTFFKDTKESIDIAFMKQFISDPAENFLFSISTQSRIGQIFNLKYHNLIKLKSEVQPNMQWLDSTHFMRIKPAPYDVRKFLYLYELRNGSIIDLFSYETDKMFSVGLMNNKIAIYCGDSIRFWDMDGNYIRAILADVFGGSVSCFSPNQSMIAFSSSRIIDKKIEPTLVVYNQIGEKMHRLESSINDFRRIKFSNKNDRLASFATDGSVQINYMNGRPMVYIPRRDCDPKIDSAIRDFHFSANDELIVSVYSDGLIRIWDSTANLTNSFQSNLTLQDANFTPDGKLIYGYDADTTLNLWDLQGNLIYTYNGHNAYFTPDGNRLYTIKNHKNKDSELRDYLTPQGAYNYFKSNKTFQKPSDNSLYGKWLKLLEWLGLS